MEFMQRKMEAPVPGSLGPDAVVYLRSLENEGRALATRYEIWRELCAFAKHLPDKAPGDITTMDIERFLAVRSRSDNGQPLSAATRKKVVAILSGFFAYLYDRDEIQRNPTRPIRRPTVPEPEPSWWTAEEVRKILNAAGTPRDLLLLTMLARTGQRVGVVRTLRWSDLALDAREPVIAFRRGKGGRVYTFPIDKVLLRLLVMYREMARPAPDDPVFLSRNGGPLSSSQIERLIKATCRAAGVREAAAHEFRRSCITNLLHAGVPFDVVSRDIAGHRNPQTTMRHYRGSESARVREALRGLPY